MKRTGKRILAVLLTALMLFTCVPPLALASLLDNDPAYNREVLSALTSLAGSEAGGQDYYDILQQYGLLDDDGKLAESWSIQMNGEDITLDELRAVLAGDYDPEAYVWVDGVPVTLEDVKTMLEIEDYVAYIQDTYFAEQEWTEEQAESYQSLMKQVQAKGITLRGGGSSLVGATGVNHGARVSVAQTSTSGNTVTFTASLTGAASGQVVSFDWRALSGSRPVSGTTSGTVSMTANSSGTASKTFNVTLASISATGTSPIRSSSTVFYVNCDHIRNALFSNNVGAISIKGTAGGSVSAADMPTTTSNTISGSTGHDSPYKPARFRDGIEEGQTVYLSNAQKNAIAWGVFNSAILTKENYDVSIGAPTDLGIQEKIDSFNGLSVFRSARSYPAYDCTATINGEALYYRTGYPLETVLTKTDTATMHEYDSDGHHYAFYDWNSNESKDLGVVRETTIMNDAGILQTSENLTTTLSPSAVPNYIKFSGGKKVFYECIESNRPNESGYYRCYQWRDDNTYTYAWMQGSYINDVRYARRLPVKTASLTGTVTFLDNNAPSIVSVTAPNATYYSGEVVPIVVTFSEPVQADATITVNGISVAAAETGASNVMTFPYTVKELDSTGILISNVKAKDIMGHALNTSPSVNTSGVTLSTPFKSGAFTSFGVTAGGNVTAPTAEVTVNLSDNSGMTGWIDASQYTANADGTFTMKNVKVTADGETFTNLSFPNGSQITGGTLVASVPLPLNSTGSDKDYVVELYVDDELVIGKAAKVTVPPAVFITAGDVSNVALTVQKTDENGQLVDYFGPESSDIIYLQDKPQLTLSYSLSDGKTYSFPELVWSSSNESVARIGNDGRSVALVGAGTCKFILTAPNGEVAGKAVTWETEEIHVDLGYTPFLYFTGDQIESVSDQALTLYWSSNLCDKNGEEPTAFHVSVTRGGEEVYTEDVTGTKSAPASSVTLPAEVLRFHYGENAVNTFGVTVTAVYNEQTFTANATVSLESLPAKIKLNALDSYYILDTVGSVNIGWDITNFNRFSSENASDLFRLLITKGSETVLNSEEPGVGNEEGHYTGSCTLNKKTLDVKTSSSDKTSYRDVYTVTIQAKNGEDSTWSYDSFLLYVYDAEALKIWVDGEEADSLTMSNIPRIEAIKDDQDQILALKRDISLKNVISANYGEYAWSELADQLSWASSNNNAATVNYQQGTLYEDIRNFSYVSYRPATEFILSGLSDGETTVTAEHVLTGMTDSVNVTVETLKNKLYLFQCYPQVETTLTYTDSTGKENTVTSNGTGAAAIYEPDGIQSDVYCRSVSGGNVYLGTFYKSQLVSGEQDSTKLQLYPCNNLQMRRAAYAYLYMKNPDGTPYTGRVTFRGGVYVDGEYKQDAKFELNNSGHVNLSGNEDQSVQLESNGKLEIVMDQTQWGLPNNEITAGDKVRYTFLIKQEGDTAYYPVFTGIDATVNQTAYVNSGEAVVNFRQNADTGAHAFIAGQTATMKNSAENYSKTSGVLDTTGRVGPTDNTPQADLTTVVMWWGEPDAQNAQIKLFTEAAQEIAPSASSQNNSGYPFADEVLTTYTVTMTADTLKGVVDCRDIKNLYLAYYRDGANLSRKESLPFRVCNMVGAGGVNESLSLKNSITNMGNAMGTDAKNGMSTGDKFVNAAMTLVASDGFTEGRGGLFNIKLSPTSDPTKFLGFVEVNINKGDMNTDSPSMEMFYKEEEESALSATPGFDELETLYYATYGGRGVSALEDYQELAMQQMEDAKYGDKDTDIKVAIGGYMETMIYFDFNAKEWKMQVLDGGFHAGGGVEYSQTWNYQVGPVPFTVELNIGGTAEVSMDAITAAYQETNESTTADLDTEFLTQLRIFLYLKLFAGVGFDYSVVAFKLGIYGQISVDMRFRWLNRPYLSKHDGAYLLATGEKNDENANLNGQNFKIDGEIGLEFVVKFLFVSYEKTLFSFSFNLLNKSTGKWNRINNLWEANRKNTQAVIEALLHDGSASVNNVGGQQMLSLNMAPAMEGRDYLDDGGRAWNEPKTRSGPFGLFKAKAKAVDGLSDLETNTYPYANPELSADGSLLVYLSDQSSTDVAETRAAFAVKSGTGYAQGGVIDDDGFGDSQLAVDGTNDFAVSAWTRQMVNIDKDEGSVLTGEDQMMMLNGTEVYASVYDGSDWVTTRLTDNAGADVAPTVAVNGEKAIVAWRSVVAGDAENITDFNHKDTILYKIYDSTAGTWSEAQSLYNGTSGEVKGITSVMMANGTSAIAYTLDIDGDDVTIADREIVYAVVGTDGGVVRNVCATSDEKVDENPQLAVVTFPTDEEEKQRFVLGWFTQETQDGANVSNICLYDFDDTGITGQLMPQSLSQATSGSSVNVSSNFRFSKNAESINELSIVWVERDQGKTETLDEGTAAEDGSVSADMSTISTEKDTLKGIKFYTYGQNAELIGFTGALQVAEMPNATLIDHFDAYTSGGTGITAALLGTTYGKDGATETKTGETSGGDTVQYTVPKAVSAMYTATDTYEDKIEVPAVKADYDTVKLGAKTQIQVNVRNNGIHPIQSLRVKIGDTVTEYADLNLLPGNTLQVWADYDVPANKIEDPDYTVTAKFDETGNQTAGGKVYLDLPDLQITDARIMEEAEGKRVIQFKLNNGSDAALAGSGRSVKLSFWSDPSHKTAINLLPDMIISDAADLQMIDEGGYSVQTTFDVAAYVKGDSAEISEIPESGVPVYIKAEVMKDGAVEAETLFTNNDAAVTCENLKARTGEDVTLVSDFAVDGEGDEASTTVTVNMQNTRLSETTTGNLIVTLLDENGEVIEQQQSYTGSSTGDNGLITLGGEAKGTESFTFRKVGANAQVAYTDVLLGADNVNLSSLTFSNIPGVTLESFTEQADGTFAATAGVADTASTTVMAVAEGGLSKVSIQANGGETLGGDSNAVSEVVSLTPARDNTITVTVTADNGDTAVYVLTVTCKKSVTVFADAKSKIYGEEDPELTYTVEGLLHGDELDVTLSRVEGENVGTYAISADIQDNNNYAVTYVGADLTITKRPLTVTADAKSKVYGDNDPELTYQADGLVGSDTLSGALTRDEGEDVSTYAIRQGTLRVDDNYDMTFVGADLTITKRPLTVTADAKRKTYHSADPELTYQIKGKAFDDKIDVSLSRAVGEEIGTYAITAEINAGSNYEVTYIGADFTIYDGGCPLCQEDHTGHKGIKAIHYVMYWLTWLFRDWLPKFIK